MYQDHVAVQEGSAGVELDGVCSSRGKADPSCLSHRTVGYRRRSAEMGDKLSLRKLGLGECLLDVVGMVVADDWRARGCAHGRLDAVVDRGRPGSHREVVVVHVHVVVGLVSEMRVEELAVSVLTASWFGGCWSL